MSLIFSCFSSHSSFPFNVVVFDFMVLGDISFVMLISVWSYGFSFTYCCCCLIIYIYVSCFLNYVFYSLYLCLLLLLSLWCLSFVYFWPFFVLVLNNQNEKWFLFIFWKNSDRRFAKRRFAIILFKFISAFCENADMLILYYFPGFFFGVLPPYGRFAKRRCAAFPRHIYRRFAKMP